MGELPVLSLVQSLCNGKVEELSQVLASVVHEDHLR